MKKKKEKVKGRGLAITCMVLMIVVSVPIGSCLSLNRERSKATEVYYGSDDTYGLLQDIDACRDAAANMVTLGGKFLEADDVLLQNVQEAGKAVQEASTPTGKASALSDLTNSMNTLYNTLCQTEMDEANETYREEIFATYNAVLDMIHRSDYNTRAAEYNAILRKAPARPLAALVGIGELELFTE